MKICGNLKELGNIGKEKVNCIFSLFFLSITISTFVSNQKHTFITNFDKN
jgi:hypothetical protein